ncbi:MAG TPA: AtzE family amidohydrolase [Caulobacteraceae bacterium]|nr:AtzE family amidohydrolase [Caulobacteraceae bacterium]
MDLTAVEIAAEVREGRRSAVEVVAAVFRQIAALNTTLNCFTGTVRDRAIMAAEDVDQAVKWGRDPGPLCGVPFAVKNLFDVEGTVTLAGSTICAENPAAAANATLVERLQAAGAVLVGSLNMDEYAYGFTTENSHYGPTRNPHDPTLIAGGSSGGSAAAVAAGLTPISLGSDTNGSIRVPAALCGVYGLKPTFGRLSRHGTTPFVHSLDHVGPFARSVRDLALVYDVLQGSDPRDPACVDRPAQPVSELLQSRGSTVRTGMLGGYFRDGASPQALSILEAVAWKLRARPVELSGAKAARAAAFCLTAAEGGSLHLPHLRTRAHDFDPAVRDRLIAGVLQPASVLAKAQRVRRWFLQEALKLFEDVDVLLAPATPFAATPIGQATTVLAGQTVSVRANLGLYAQPFSFIGLPVLTVPVVRAKALPMGVQLIAAPWNEGLLFQVAAALEAEGVIGAKQPSHLRGVQPSVAPVQMEAEAHGGQ